MSYVAFVYSQLNVVDVVVVVVVVVVVECMCA